MLRILAIASLALAQGCSAPRDAQPPGATHEEVNACHVERYQGLVGQVISTLDPASLPANHRVICLGCMASMIYIADRLTIQMGPGNTIASVRCG